MAKYCNYCFAELDLGREFVYEFESLKFVDDEQQLEAIRQSPFYYGEPLMVCKACSDRIARNQEERREEELAEARLVKSCHKIVLSSVFVLN